MKLLPNEESFLRHHLLNGTDAYDTWIMFNLQRDNPKVRFHTLIKHTTLLIGKDEQLRRELQKKYRKTQ